MCVSAAFPVVAAADLVPRLNQQARERGHSKPTDPDHMKIRGVAVIIAVMAMLLPLLAISLLALWLFDRLLLPRLPAFAIWLGIRPAQMA